MKIIYMKYIFFNNIITPLYTQYIQLILFLFYIYIFRYLNCTQGGEAAFLLPTIWSLHIMMALSAWLYRITSCAAVPETMASRSGTYSGMSSYRFVFVILLLCKKIIFDRFVRQ